MTSSVAYDRRQRKKKELRRRKRLEAKRLRAERKEQKKDTSRRESESESEPGQQCSVCYEKLKRGWKCEGCNQRQIHYSCISMWIMSKQMCCPLCRHRIHSKTAADIIVKVARKNRKATGRAVTKSSRA